MLIYDAPPPVGYSYCGDDVAGDGYSCGDWDDYRAARAAHAFVENWLAEFPAFGHNKLFLSGESYAGVCAVLASPEFVCVAPVGLSVSGGNHPPRPSATRRPGWVHAIRPCDSEPALPCCSMPILDRRSSVDRPIRLSLLCTAPAVLPRASACYSACWYPCVSPSVAGPCGQVYSDACARNPQLAYEPRQGPTQRHGPRRWVRWLRRVVWRQSRPFLLHRVLSLAWAGLA